MNRYQIASDRYILAFRAARAMANAAPILMGPPRDFKVFKVYAAYPAYTKEQIAAAARRSNRLFRIMNRYQPQRIAA
jgi:hypothetical protein